MQRRDALKQLGIAGGMITLSPWITVKPTKNLQQQISDAEAYQAIEQLQGEPAAKADVRIENGGPRLYVNDKQVYPLMALSTALIPTISNYEQADIHFYNPLLGMRTGWKGPNQYDWTIQDAFLGRLLKLNPNAYFIPRLQLNTPNWWKERHPDELIQYGYSPNKKRFNVIKKLKMSEGGFYYRSGREMWEASFASEPWRNDTGEMLRAYIRHIQNSPLKSRIIGYHFSTGKTGEWNYYGPGYLPDYSPSMKRACGGSIPSPDNRTNTSYGLLRDPEKEKDVIEFYQHFHNAIVDTILYLAKTIREETQGTVLTGIFYGYLLEQVRIQEGGYLACERIVKSPDLDFIISPYTYQGNNFDGDKNQRSGVVDDAGNWLGRARGVGGDGGFRIPVESVERHKKLFISEMDPSTYTDKKYHGEGGPGSMTLKGSEKILRRDLGQMFAKGVGGWLYDFGPLHDVRKGWYGGKPIINIMKQFSDFSSIRTDLNVRSVSEILSVYDDKTFTATEHWLVGKPWKGYGIGYCDFFNHWFLNSQARSLHRIGAPMHFIYRFDLMKNDPEKYKLIFMVNLFYLDDKAVDHIRKILRDSGTTVVWFYAPGFISPDKLDKTQMERLTGFQFRELKTPGPMMIDSHIETDNQNISLKFGLSRKTYPRFSITDSYAEVLGKWSDNEEAAFARKEYDGWTSVYVGTAPLPVEILRWLAQEAGASLWSSRADNVRAVEDAAMILASSESGKRDFSLHKPMRQIDGENYSKKHRLNMKFGDVKLFVA